MEIYFFTGRSFSNYYFGYDSLQYDRYVFMGQLGDTRQVAAVSVVGPLFLCQQQWRLC